MWVIPPFPASMQLVLCRYTPFPAPMQLVLSNYSSKCLKKKLPSFSMCEACGAPTNIGDNWKDIINNLAIVNKILDL